MPPISPWLTNSNQAHFIVLLLFSLVSQSFADEKVQVERGRGRGQVKDEFSWESWQPGDNGHSNFLIVIDEILAPDAMIVTPVPRLPKKDRSYPTAVSKLAVMQGLVSGDAVMVRECGEQRRDKRFLLKGIPTNSYFCGAVLSVSGDFAVSRAEESESQIICATTKNGSASPEPRTDDAGIPFEESISWKTWRPKTVGRSRLVGKVEKVLSRSSAIITPLNDDDLLMPYKW